MGAERLTERRVEYLLDQVVLTFGSEGFASVRVADLASRLACSPSTLYKLAASKESLAILAVNRWTSRTLADAKAEAETLESPSARARRYFGVVAERLAALSPAFRTDVSRFDGTRAAWADAIEEFTETFSGYLAEAARAGEVRPVNPRFMTLILRQIAEVLRDMDALAECGMTVRAALDEVDRLVWNGICLR